MTKTDEQATTVTIDRHGLVRVDQVVLFKMIQCNNEPWIVVQDRNRQRSCVRGTNQIQVPLDALVAKLVKEDEKKGRTRQ